MQVLLAAGHFYTGIWKTSVWRKNWTKVFIRRIGRHEIWLRFTQSPNRWICIVCPKITIINSQFCFLYFMSDYIIWWQQLIGKHERKYKTKGVMISRSQGSNWSRKRKSNAATVWLRCQQTVRAIFSGLFVRKNQSQIQTKTLVMYDDYSEGIELQCWGGTPRRYSDLNDVLLKSTDAN